MGAAPALRSTLSYLNDEPGTESSHGTGTDSCLARSQKAATSLSPQTGRGPADCGRRRWRLLLAAGNCSVQFDIWEHWSMTSTLQQEGGTVTWEGEFGVTELKRCALSEYQQIVGMLPRPTDAQIDNYVEYVSGAHSWYKHLPFFPPGLPYFFYLDPTAGCDRVVHASGGISVRERTAESSRGHYNLRTTGVYRNDYGHLAYGGYIGACAEAESDGSILDRSALPHFITPEVVRRIPAEIAAVSGVRLLATVHNNASAALMFAEMLPRMALRAPQLLTSDFWRPHLGDSIALVQLRRLFHPRTDAPMAERTEGTRLRLAAAERLRQRGEMASAIRRMLALVYGDQVGTDGSKPLPAV